MSISEKDQEELKAECEALKEANDNCISLLVHESRMRNVEEENAKLRAENERLNKENELLKDEAELAKKRQHKQVDHIEKLHEENFRLRESGKALCDSLTNAQKRFSHIEDWHRHNVTPNNFEDCQDVGLTPEAFLRNGKNECKKALVAHGEIFMGEK